MHVDDYFVFCADINPIGSMYDIFTHIWLICCDRLGAHLARNRFCWTWWFLGHGQVLRRIRLRIRTFLVLEAPWGGCFIFKTPEIFPQFFSAKLDGGFKDSVFFSLTWEHYWIYLIFFNWVETTLKPPTKIIWKPPRKVSIETKEKRGCRFVVLGKMIES